MAVIGIAAKILQIGAINTSTSNSTFLTFGPSKVWVHMCLSRVAVNDDDGTAISSVSVVEGGVSKPSSAPAVFAGFPNKNCTRADFLLQVVDCQATAVCTVEFLD
jgi:hypothetical protein